MNNRRLIIARSLSIPMILLLAVVLLWPKPQTQSTAQGLTGTITIGGSVLLAGACLSGTSSITGAPMKAAVILNPEADPIPALTTGIAVHAWVSSAGVVTVRECALVGVTPTSVVWDITVVPRQ
jgi:hypothetical protein